MQANQLANWLARWGSGQTMSSTVCAWGNGVGVAWLMDNPFYKPQLLDSSADSWLLSPLPDAFFDA
jgi:hypothetical protein